MQDVITERVTKPILFTVIEFPIHLGMTDLMPK